MMVKSFKEQIAENLYYDEENARLYCYYYKTLFLIAEGADFSRTIIGAFADQASCLRAQAVKRFESVKEAEEFRSLEVDDSFRDYIVTRRLGDYLDL